MVNIQPFGAAIHRWGVTGFDPIIGVFLVQPVGTAGRTRAAGGASGPGDRGLLLHTGSLLCYKNAGGAPMATRIIDGKAVADEIRRELALRAAHLKERGIVPGLGVILVGEDPASVSYVTGKERACAEMGFYSGNRHLSARITEEELLSHVRELNGDPRIHGILVQLPLPGHIDEERVLLAIAPEKDVDGLHPVSVGKLVLGQTTFIPCTAHGIVKLLVKSGVALDGAHVVIVGRSNLVGRPLANLLTQRTPEGNATVTLCHTHTRNLAEHTARADILIAAAGSPRMITADMVKEGAVVIDVGVNRVEDSSRKKGFRLVGDVDFDGVKEKASLITPVPGGVGPLTITMLLYNTLESAERRSASVAAASEG